jgi:hypothetical protein
MTLLNSVSAPFLSVVLLHPELRTPTGPCAHGATRVRRLSLSPHPRRRRPGSGELVALHTHPPPPRPDLIARGDILLPWVLWQSMFRSAMAAKRAKQVFHWPQPHSVTDSDVPSPVIITSTHTLTKPNQSTSCNSAVHRPDRSRCLVHSAAAAARQIQPQARSFSLSPHSFIRWRRRRRPSWRHLSCSSGSRPVAVRPLAAWFRGATLTCRAGRDWTSGCPSVFAGRSSVGAAMGSDNIGPRGTAFSLSSPIVRQFVFSYWTAGEFGFRRSWRWARSQLSRLHKSSQ